MADLQFWNDRKAEFEHCAKEFPDLEADWDGVSERWWFSTPEGKNPLVEAELAFKVAAGKAAAGLPDGGRDAQPWELWLDAMRLECEDDKPRTWGFTVRSERGVTGAEREGRQNGKTLAQVRTEAGRHPFGYRPADDLEDYVDYVVTGSVARLFESSALFCGELAARAELRDILIYGSVHAARKAADEGADVEGAGESPGRETDPQAECDRIVRDQVIRERDRVMRGDARRRRQANTVREPEPESQPTGYQPVWTLRGGGDEPEVTPNRLKRLIRRAAADLGQTYTGLDEAVDVWLNGVFDLTKPDDDWRLNRLLDRLADYCDEMATRCHVAGNSDVARIYAELERQVRELPDPTGDLHAIRRNELSREANEAAADAVPDGRADRIPPTIEWDGRPRRGRPRKGPNLHPGVEAYLDNVGAVAKRPITIKDFCRVSGFADDTVFGFWRLGNTQRCSPAHQRRFAATLKLTPQEFLEKLAKKQRQP